MLDTRVSNVPTLVFPSTTTRTASGFFGFLGSGTLRASGVGTGIHWHGRQIRTYNEHVNMSRTQDLLSTYLGINPACFHLTFAGIDAIGPCKIKCCVPGITTILKPGTATNTTTWCFVLLARGTFGASETYWYTIQKTVNPGKICAHMMYVTHATCSPQVPNGANKTGNEMCSMFSIFL